VVRISITVPLSIGFVTPWKVCCPSERAPQPRYSIASRLYHCNGLGSFRFARRYSGSRSCFLFLGVLRCFNSPGSLHWAYFIQPRVTGHLPLPGFPIRISTDRSLVGGSPWLIAATHVLHRHLAPRHPPLALCSLESSRCSCSLCSSQGAVALQKNAVVTARCCHAAPADQEENRPKGPRRGPGAVPSKRNSDDR
jgi:hypothetical protein